MCVCVCVCVCVFVCIYMMLITPDKFHQHSIALVFYRAPQNPKLLSANSFCIIYFFNSIVLVLV